MVENNQTLRASSSFPSGASRNGKSYLSLTVLVLLWPRSKGSRGWAEGSHCLTKFSARLMEQGEQLNIILQGQRSKVVAHRTSSRRERPPVVEDAIPRAMWQSRWELVYWVENSVGKVWQGPRTSKGFTSQGESDQTRVDHCGPNTPPTAGTIQGTEVRGITGTE